MQTVINIHKISKKYTLGEYEPYRTLRDSISAILTPKSLLNTMKKLSKKEEKNEFWALKNISFKVNSGEIVGVIGKNGAGKSTLLKILSRITPPTSGEIRINGKMSSLLEVGTGFNPELTGRENIFLNGAILGMKQKEIRKKLDQIVDFSGVEKFLDSPIKHYSSGMHVRLAFAVAAHLDSEVLLIDEVLAVGDADFQNKCLMKMEEVTTNEGRTIIFVSHNLEAVKKLCPKTVLLDRGKIDMYDDTNVVIKSYLGKSSNDTNIKLRDRLDRKGNGQIKFENIEFLNTNSSGVYEVGNEILIRVTVISKYSDRVKRRIVLTINTLDQIGLISCDSSISNEFLDIDGQTTSVLICKVTSARLNQGQYAVNLAVFGETGPEDWIIGAAKFVVVSKKFLPPAISTMFPVYSDFSWSKVNK